MQRNRVVFAISLLVWSEFYCRSNKKKLFNETQHLQLNIFFIITKQHLDASITKQHIAIYIFQICSTQIMREIVKTSKNIRCFLCINDCLLRIAAQNMKMRK